MTVSMMVFICLVSFRGFGESFSAGGRPRRFLALEPPSSLLETSLSWRLLRLRFFSRISSSISSRFPSSIACHKKTSHSKCRVNSNHTKHAGIFQLCVNVAIKHLYMKCSEGLIAQVFHVSYFEKVWILRTAWMYHQNTIKLNGYSFSIPVSLKQQPPDPQSIRRICPPLRVSVGEGCHIEFCGVK